MESTRRIEESKALCINYKCETKNILPKTSYRQPAGRYNEFEIYLKQLLCKSKK